MSIKTGELPRASSVTANSSMLVNTDNGTKQLDFGKASQFFEEALRPTIQSEAAEQVQKSDGFEAGSVKITNGQAYPFNSGTATIVLNTPRQNMNYVVNVEVTAATGNVQTVEVYDKQLNGFKLRYDGSATSATIKYYVTGGMQA